MVTSWAVAVVVAAIVAAAVTAVVVGVSWLDGTLPGRRRRS